MKKSYMRRWAICICAFVLAVSTVTAQKKKVLPKAVPGTSEPLALVSLGDCTPGLAPFNFNSDNSKWNFRKQ
ncbi:MULTISPECIES: hypothetical protein [unclassified Prevotella]|uniref:hypothetical protein n=1 Tax=unclassified Prevotella TaxID=2638335 RepID=UPI000B966A1C|nr:MULTISPECIES: hypothetical protein [unclassified Prevotella]OYP50786.1 hypothetical protein CIK93_07125 [Prevotella sp. P3-92]